MQLPTVNDLYCENIKNRSKSEQLFFDLNEFLYESESHQALVLPKPITGQSAQI